MYALGKKNGVVADWEKFARDHDKSFDRERTEDLDTAVEYLLHEPPLKQVLNNGALDWKSTKVENVPLFLQLIRSVGRVRNNLFHGGKFPSMDVIDPGRNTDLLKSSIVILQECLCLNERVGELFYQRHN